MRGGTVLTAVNASGLSAALLLTSCVSRDQNARSAFTASFDCPEEQVTVSFNSRGTYQVTGCGKSVPVTCTSADICYVDGQMPQVASDEVTGDGKLFYSANLEPDALLKISAWPAGEGKAELELVTPRGAGCYLEIAVNDKALSLQPRSTREVYVVPPDSMHAFESAVRVSVNGCGGDWALDDRQLKNLRLFARAFAEQRGVAEEKKPAAKRKAPTGGWASWQGLGNFPGGSGKGEALPGPDLYEKLAPSVLRVEAALSEGVSQGSAVAVAPTLALTNCHVLEGATKITVAQRGSEWAATLKQSDPARDRCIIEVAAAMFTPITGVRPFADLRVGETLYTLGAPSGLDLTLANGILSARREDEGVRYVQTTAPISPGSSGGGLFDAYGNLVGITTMVLIGKDNHNQALNFAIAAEMFWSP